MKKELIIVILLFMVFSTPLIFASVFINEVELNPSGAPDKEWVEIYSDGNSEVNITGYYLQDRDGNNYTLTNETILGIKGMGFLIIENLTSNAFVNSGENISLLNRNGVLLDFFSGFVDNGNDNETWQRVPDGKGTFVFKNQTKNFTNVLTTIGNKTSFPFCPQYNSNLTLSANVSGFCVENVTFSLFSGGVNILNISGINSSLSPTNFSASIDPSNLNGIKNINWTIFVLDCFDKSKRNGVENFVVRNMTALSVSPTPANGANGWYVSEPNFILNNIDAEKIFYRWNGNFFNYTGPFGLEGTPNDGNVTGGIHVLKYWSNITCKIENEKNNTYKFDFTDPLIDDKTPTPGSIIYLNNKPMILANLNEIFQSNSGIDVSTIKMIFNGTDVSGDLEINDSDPVHVSIKYTPPTNLTQEGFYDVLINVSDIAGRNSQMNWSFFLNLTLNPFNMTINSPVNGSNLDTRRIMINLTTTKKSTRIELINWNDRRPRWRTLCRNCHEYGSERKKTKSMDEGNNSIGIRATSMFGEIIRNNISFFVDSKPPRISKTLPRRGMVTNGSDFSVKYTEDNIMSVSISWNPTLDFTIQSNCSSGRNQICAIDLSSNPNFTSLNGQEIDFSFNVSDSLTSVMSRVTNVLVDVSPPILNVTSPINETNYTRRVPFNISVDGDVALEFIDFTDSRPRWKRLCSRCDEYGNDRLKRKSFNKGEHNISIRAVDKAGNSDEKMIFFSII